MRPIPALAVSTALLVSACGPNEIDTQQVETQLGKDTGSQVTCPAHVESVPGRHFACSWEDGGVPRTVEVTVTDDHGGYSYRINVLGGGLPSPEFGPPVG